MTTAANAPSGSAPTTASASDRHDIVTSALGTPWSRSADSSCGAPGRHGTCSVTRLMTRASSSSTIRSGSQGTAELSLMNVADTSRSLPTSWWANSSLHAPVLLDDLVLRGDPVGLGVDEGAVHVPEDRCGEAHGWRARSRRVESRRQEDAVIELEDLPEPHDAVMIAAFEGWNDAGEAASAVVEHLAEIWDAEVVAALDPEDYYDFQVNRPRVLLENGRRRSAGAPRGARGDEHSLGRDVVLVQGVEPSFRWRAFAIELMEPAQAADVSMVITPAPSWPTWRTPARSPSPRRPTWRTPGTGTTSR